ncbi:unnamed protein product [Candida verbasci]|uniref:Stress-activated map kinase-interacting protein 1 n=1 Tax=Candida verbasci TaxID=1227364 RepID=A0A9W4TUD9_9ASCO|nr:unnamed protein product [Candida verbasci]
MAFLLNKNQLLYQLRASYLAVDNSELTKDIIKLPVIDKDDGQFDDDISNNIPISESPPITFEIARHLKKSLHNDNHHHSNHKHHHNKINNKKSRIKPNSNSKKNTELSRSDIDKSSLIENDNHKSIIENELSPIIEPPNHLSESLSNDNSSISTHKTTNFGLKSSKTIKGGNGQKKEKSRTKSKIPIVKFFQGKEKKDVNSDSDSDNDQRNIYSTSDLAPTIELSDDTNATETEDLNEVTSPTSEINNSNDTISIDSDFGVPVDSKGQVVHHYNKNDKIEKSESDLSDEETDEYDTFEEDDEDEESNDSEFTDLNNDSMIDSSLMMGTFDENHNESYSFIRTSTTSDFNSKKSRKKKKVDPFDQFSDSKDSVKLLKDDDNLTLTKKQPELSFDKIKPPLHDSETKSSNLSSLIQSKFKSSNNNPLNYYLFVDSDTISGHKVDIDIYLAPSKVPILKSLKICPSTVVIDFIGFILLNLYKLPEFNNKTEFSYMNPNCWKLELVDEDGENYGSFGVLDRTRSISSYNNPKELAICKVEDLKEISKNESQTPLPIEFKQSLADFQRKRNSIDQIVLKDDQTNTQKIELTIIVYEYDTSIPEKSNIKVPSNYRMGQVLKEFCVQKNLITTKYRFKLVSSGRSRFVRDVEICMDLESKVLELVPSESRINSMIDDHGQANITPSEFTLPNLTLNVGQLDEKTQKLTLQDFKQPTATLLKPETTRKSSANSAKSIKKAILERNNTSNKHLNDILLGNNPQLPININTVYFKWRVFKNNSKIKIKNFSEKNFIIDGDYIHLTPPDDLTLRNTGQIESMTESNLIGGHHKNHHLNHQFNKAHNKHSTKTYSFHITQILKLKQYTKTPNYFRIIIQKQQDSNIINNSNTKDISKEMVKKFYLLALNEVECSEIIEKLKWVLHVYNFSGVI